jgi:hypothetical protein
MIKLKLRAPAQWIYLQASAIYAIHHIDDWCRVLVGGAWHDVDHNPQQIMDAMRRAKSTASSGGPQSIFEAVFGPR